MESTQNQDLESYTSTINAYQDQDQIRHNARPFRETLDIKFPVLVSKTTSMTRSLVFRVPIEMVEELMAERPDG